VLVGTLYYAGYFDVLRKTICPATVDLAASIHLVNSERDGGQIYNNLAKYA